MFKELKDSHRDWYIRVGRGSGLKERAGRGQDLDHTILLVVSRF